MTSPIPILVYHRIDEQGLSTSTPPRQFRQHLLWLSRHGWRSLSVGEFEFYASRGRDFPSKSFVLHFDDGYESIASAALPVLQELNFQAVCFAATQLIRGAAGTGEPQTPGDDTFLSWEQIRALQSGGQIEFHSHTHAHKRSVQLAPQDLMHDLETSRDLLAAELALPRSHFTHLAWPWGESDRDCSSVARKCGFHYQYTVLRAAFRHASPLIQIPRTCYDGASYVDFQMQLWLQCGPLSWPWHVMYPVARKLRQPRAQLPAGRIAPAANKATDRLPF